ncbi:MAG: hypothetical protein GC190_11720 [Alphaproteobacteria bacterium]|nr:hypothetical protein [Alphaproteobacteria bacterium]
MKRVIAAGICFVFFAFGLIRIGVASALSAQLLGYFSVGAFEEPIRDTSRFLNEHNTDAFIQLTPLPYFGIIFAMGVCLALGAVGAFRKKAWGYALIVAYLSMHAGLFLNFQTINPKINILIGAIVLLLALVWANGGRAPESTQRA